MILVSCLRAWQTHTSAFLLVQCPLCQPFALVHCDVWTSPVLSTLGYKYYLVMPGDFSHFYWSFPLPQKFEVYGRFVDFVAYAQTQFGSIPKCFQVDNGNEILNQAMYTFL